MTAPFAKSGNSLLNIGQLTISAVIVLLVVLPILNLWVSENSFWHVSTYTISLFGKYLTFALLAMALDLIWGYLGILSLGHGAYFALGGYVMGMYLTQQTVPAGSLPSFMGFLNWTTLPWFWQGANSFWITLILIAVIPALLAYFIGFLSFRSRVSGVYFSIITQALTFALMLIFYLNEVGLGGNNGFTGFKVILGFDITNNFTRIILFEITGLILILTYFFLKSILASRLGKLLIAVRDQESRVRFIGYKVEHVHVSFFVLSAIIAGIAGALYVPQVGIINPNLFDPVFSIEIAICVALGGRGTLYGAIIGAFLVNFAKSYLTVQIPDAWLFILGGLFVVVTLFLPKGIVSLLRIYNIQKLKGKSA